MLAPRWGSSLVRGIRHLAQLVTLAFELRDRAKQHGIAGARCEAEGSMANGIRRDGRWHTARQQMAWGKTAIGIRRDGKRRVAKWQVLCYETEIGKWHILRRQLACGEVENGSSGVIANSRGRQ